MSQNLRLYLHIPFCVRKCNYCDFVSFAGKEELFGKYTEALCNEIRAYGKLYGKTGAVSKSSPLKAGSGQDRQITSIYIGGGTPSVLPVDMMSQIIETLMDSFSISGTKEKRRGFHLQKKIRPVTEFSIECNPGTVDKQKLKSYKKLGINRISFGLQSTDAADLNTLGRIHSFDNFVDSFEAAREAGFSNINVDLMQAIPGQTLVSWQRTLALLATWKPEHISAYSLIVEEGTPFYEWQQEGKLPLPDEDTEREIYYYTKEFLENTGYTRYEISNYALQGFECQHNIGYWKRDDYLGLGLHAASLIDNCRWKNTEKLDSYIEAMTDPAQAEEQIGHAFKAMTGPAQAEELIGHALEAMTDPAQAEEQPIICDLQKLSHKERMEEFVFLGLRMTTGISKKNFFETFGQDFDFTYGEKVRGLKAQGLLDVQDDRVYLTERGIDVSNTVLAEFLLDDLQE